ncbi:E3 ubiquitin-protein ligase TRIM47 [Engraulis encrasicolus]|uniref:E3 ubiquitin-protein ligase TRIM47 n=1 Tax=Engraulis encrasicolus TaxID=184585 RepID=UPI002FD40476
MEDCAKTADTILEDQDPFSCPVCLDPLEEPVTIPCGHSYCMGCIRDCWDQEETHKRGAVAAYSCPQCRQTFQPRPVLNKNTMFAEVVERLKRTSLRAVAPPPGGPCCYAGPGDVGCDVCSEGRKQRAVRTCLCIASYCETHLRLHEGLHPGQSHRMIDPSEHQVKFCSRHGKRLEGYCRTDHSFVCHLCVTDDHRGHDVVVDHQGWVHVDSGHRSRDGHSSNNNHGTAGGGHRSGQHRSSTHHHTHHRHGTAGQERGGGHVKSGHGGSGGGHEKKKRKHGSRHGKRQHKSDGHGSWHQAGHHEKSGQTGH